jgi:hypothetical protein
MPGPYGRLTVACTLLLAAGMAHAERTVVTHAGTRVVLADSADWCGERVRLTVRASDPSVFEGDRLELQRLIGGARGILGFECPSVRHIEVVGEAGHGPVFAARALASNNWLLEVEEREPVARTEPPAEPEPPAPPPARLDILNLRPGMPRDTARDLLATVFREDELDVYAEYLFAERGCTYSDPASLGREIGAVCVISRFEDGLLERVVLREVHPGAAAATLRARLERLHGEPSITHGVGAPEPSVWYLAWGPLADIDRSRLHRDDIRMPVAPLEARLHQEHGVTVLTMRLDDPARAAERLSRADR